MKEEIDVLMEKIDRRCKLPKHWEEFIKNSTKEHRIIIKDRFQKNLYCTNCNNYFFDKTIKVREYVKCPNCKKKSEVYGMNYNRKSFEQSVILVQKLNKQVIIRVFEIWSYFMENSKKVNRSCIEYARILPGIGKFLGSNVYMNMFGGMTVYHNNRKLWWSKYKGYRYFTHFPTYPYNKKRLLKGTNMEYAPINEFIDKFSYYGYNFLDVLSLAAYGSFELLWNMKLYNLCFYSKDLNKNGSFYKRFGVSKSFLKYMQDKNISYRELMLLRLFQKTEDGVIEKYKYYNINYLRFLVKNKILDEFMQSNNDLHQNEICVLKEIGKYIPLRKLKNYPKGLNNLYIYRDYLKMANELALNYKSRKDLFPRNLISRHDKLQKKIKISEDIEFQSKTYKRYLELVQYTYSDDKYIIFPAPSLESLKDEGRQQGNCVGQLYVTPYIDKETEIFFVRKLADVNKSFITLEFKNGRIKQKELRDHSRDFTKEQNEFLEKWIAYRNFIDKKKKYETKVKDTIKYDLPKQVA